ncbi:MAG: mevalonate kinase [Anaerolineaceae bacterium]|nr:mevalonate kinase [Anaerolineaceae bacterium]
MPAISASAPGKIILFGEHAVVYGRPAIAAPVLQVRATATALADIRGASGHIRLEAPAIGLSANLADLPADHPLALAARLTMEALQAIHPPAVTLRVTSTIPVASGLGSGAATSVALIRAFSGFLGRPLPDEQVNAIAFEVEKIYHGTPSGIDNTTVTYAQPVYYIRGQPIEKLQVKHPFTVVIADTGVPGLTAKAVGDVRNGWRQDAIRYENLFDQIGEITRRARQVIEGGDSAHLGRYMNENQEILEQLGVSSPELNRLIQIARESGAYGAKLSGGGQGGNLIALAESDSAGHIAETLQNAGAVHTLITSVQS